MRTLSTSKVYFCCLSFNGKILKIHFISLVKLMTYYLQPVQKSVIDTLDLHNTPPKVFKSISANIYNLSQNMATRDLSVYGLEKDLFDSTKKVNQEYTQVVRKSFRKTAERIIKLRRFFFFLEQITV